VQTHLEAPSMRATYWAENRLVLAHIYTSTGALVIGAFFGLLQAFSRANWIIMPAWFDYYRALTVHGVLLALVFTTFFITGLSLFNIYRSIPRERMMTIGWLGYWLMLAGTVMAAVVILRGDATVLYTFYAPLKAHPAFYIGATLIVLGTWCVGFEVLEHVWWFRKHNVGQPIPLVVHGTACTFAMWYIATIGIVAEMLILIPWSLGWTPTINVMLTRMLFWYFGHPLVYFWIMGAYLIWYNMIPTTYGGKVFSDPLTRLAFLMLLVLSTPVGLHHEFLEPGIAAGWKWLHMVLTYGVAIPSFMTAFAIFASFEMAMQRQGRKGFISTIRGLPWTDPTFTGAAFGMILFIFGGFGGIVNASYSMDVLVHNTMWIVGHFHITVGGPVALTFIGATYRLVPALTGRKLWAPKLALAQTWMWFIGMAMMSSAMHTAGLLGAPRRTSDVTYMGLQGAQSWHPEMVFTAIGGTLLYISILMFAVVAVGTRFVNEPATSEFPFARTDEQGLPSPPVFDRLLRWSSVALGLAVLAYVGPFRDLFSQHVYLVPGMRTW
jgi:cytochrome c oxidase subunit 1